MEIRLISRKILIFLVFLAIFCWTEAHADVLDHWQWLSPLPQGNSLRSMAMGNNTIVAVGDSGSIITSQDGINWTVRTSPTSANLKGIAYGNNTFVAVGSGAIITSPDGIYWTLQTYNGDLNGDMNLPVFLGEFTGIAYGNNTFVAVGEFSTGVITSPDGVTWTHHYLPGYSEPSLIDTVSLGRVTYSNNVFFALGVQDCNGWCYGLPPPVAYSSPDGIVWTTVATSQYPFLPGDGYGVVYGNDVYIKLAGGLIIGAGDLSVSADAVTWTPVSLPAPVSPSFGFNRKCYFIKGKFYYLGEYGYIASSLNGVDWTLITSAPLQPIIEVAYGNGVWVAIGGTSISTSTIGGTSISTSTDGNTWTQQYFTNEDPYDFTGITYGNNTFVAVGLYKTVLTSPDGKQWTRNTLGFNGLDDIAFGNGTFVGVSYNSLLTSPDGIIWTVSASYPPAQYTGTRFSRITFGNGIFAAIGFDTESVPRNDVVYTSPDGVSWTEHILDTPDSFKGLNDICYGNNTFLIVGRIGYVFRSSDGVNWSGGQACATTPGGGITCDDRYGLAYGDGLFVSVGESNTRGDIQSSPDGITWTRRKSIASGELYYVAYVNHSFIASSDDTAVLQSVGDDTPEMISLYGSFPDAGIWKWDGSSWSQVTPSNPEAIVASGSSLYGDFGSNGIWQWNGSTWNQVTPNDPQMMAVSGSNLYGAFAGGGIWKWDGSLWSQVTPSNPEAIVASGSNLYGDFGSSGIWQRDGSTWNQTTPNDPLMISVSGSTLYGAFSGAGIWKWDGSAWSLVTPSNPEAIVASGSNLYGDFGSSGIWQWDGSTWNQATPSNPIIMSAADSLLYGAFAGGGIWQWDSTNWTQVTPNNPVSMMIGF